MPTPVASSGPWFVAVIVKTTVSPTFGVALSTVLPTAISAAAPIVVSTFDVLLARFGSATFAGSVIVPVFVNVAAPIGAVPSIVIVIAPPVGNVGTDPLTALPATVGIAQTAPPVSPPQVAVMALMPAGTVSA